MTGEELNKLRGYYNSLINIQRGLEKADDRIFRDEGEIILSELKRIKADFPELIPPYPQHFFSSDSRFFSRQVFVSYLGMVIGRLKGIFDTQDNTPITETRDFSFAHDPELRRVIERDYIEIQRAYISQCWKSVIILSGGAIEAILLDCLQHDSGRAKSASKAPNKPDLSRWGLSKLIDVCVELNHVSSGVEKLSHSVREYRNLVHPGIEIRNQLTFGQEESRIALEVLNIIHRNFNQ